MKKIFTVLFVVLLAINTCYSASNPTLFYSYDATQNGTYKVYVQVEDSLYAMFKIVHQVDKKQNKNLWRVMDSFFAIYQNSKMTTSTEILTPGENEFVWLSGRTGVTEFTGGFHGNERIDSLENTFAKFYADGIEIAHSNTTNLIPCSSFNYHQLSTMHQTGAGGTITSAGYVPVPNFPIECLHEKKTIFEAKGYTTQNKVTWTNNNASVKRMYYGIFCVTNDMSKFGYNDLGNDNPVIVSFNSDGQYKLKSDIQRIVMYNDVTKKSVVCDAQIISGGPFQLNTSVWDTSIYHKYYTAIQNSSPIQTSNNEVWETIASIKYDNLNNVNTSTKDNLKTNKHNRVYVTNGRIIVENAITPLYLYDVHGKLLSIKNTANNYSIVEFNVANKGTYIVRSEKGADKVTI